MKRRLLSLLLILLLLAALLPAAFAEAPAAEETPAPDFPYVLDQAGLLRDSQREALEQKAAALSEQHQCALYIVTVQDHTQYNPDVYEAAKGIFQYYDLGWGAEKNGVILLLSMGERDYAFAGHGDLGETICGHESSWLIEDRFLDDLRGNDWNGAFEDFLDACGEQLTKLENGEDINAGADIITGPDGLEYHDYNNPYDRQRSILPRVLAVIFVPLAVALIVCLSFKSQMKTAKEAVRADEYLVPHSIKLRVQEDRFTHRTESRTLIESDSGHRSSGGGGSSFHSGGGFSGRSGKF